MSAPHARGGAQVLILLCTYQGATYLEAQLASIAAQSHAGWRLWVSDDGSTDGTRDLVRAFAARHPDRDIRLLDGPQKGASAPNFLTLLGRSCADGPPPGPVAFCDQDDVWRPEKIARALQHLGHRDRALYCSRVTMTDAKGAPTRDIPPPRRALSFGNALVQNMVTGNTIVMTPAAAAEIAATVPAALQAGVPFHDWWVYLVATGCGIDILHDLEPMVLYRQHGGNEQGARQSARGYLARLKMLRNRDYAGWIGCNLAGLAAISDQLTPQARMVRDGFATWRARPPRTRRWHEITQLGIHRQTATGDRLLRIMAACDRV